MDKFSLLIFLLVCSLNLSTIFTIMIMLIFMYLLVQVHGDQKWDWELLMKLFFLIYSSSDTEATVISFTFEAIDKGRGGRYPQVFEKTSSCVDYLKRNHLRVWHKSSLGGEFSLVRLARRPKSLPRPREGGGELKMGTNFRVKGAWFTYQACSNFDLPKNFTRRARFGCEKKGAPLASHPITLHHITWHDNTRPAPAEREPETPLEPLIPGYYRRT